MAPPGTGEAKNLKVYPGCVLGRGLFEDSAIEERDADDLDRTSFAVRVAQLCSDVAQESESSVLAVIGAWGSGKSSLLSLVDDELSHTDALDWTVVRFNPWLFSDLDTLLREFFAAISHAMGTDRGAELRKKISGYVDGISPLGKFGSLVGVDASKMVERLAQQIRGEKTVDGERKSLEQSLREVDFKIIVIIDDMDRLQPSELLMVLKLVRMVARLPNIYYLLAYDEVTLMDVLMQSDLARDNEARARAYMEKIVQVRLDIPPLTLTQKLRLFNEGLQHFSTRYDVRLPLEEMRRLETARDSFMWQSLTQPRAIKRFFGQAEAFYPLPRQRGQLRRLHGDDLSAHVPLPALC